MILSCLKYNRRIFPKRMCELFVNFNLVLELLNLNAYLFEVPNSEIYSIGLLNSLISDIINGDSLKCRLLYDWRNYKNSHRHKSISTVVKIKSYMFLIRFDQLINISIKQQISLNRFRTQFRGRDPLQ